MRNEQSITPISEIIVIEPFSFPSVIRSHKVMLYGSIQILKEKEPLSFSFGYATKRSPFEISVV